MVDGRTDVYSLGADSVRNARPDGPLTMGEEPLRQIPPSIDDEKRDARFEKRYVTVCPESWYRTSPRRLANRRDDRLRKTAFSIRRRPSAASSPHEPTIARPPTDGPWRGVSL